MDYYNNETILEQAREIESLRQQLVSVTKERDEIAAQARMLDRMVDERDEQLATALAACEAKDTEFRKIVRMGNHFDVLSMVMPAHAGLDIQPDASALKAHDDALIERCAGLINKLEEANATRSPETTTTVCSTPST